MGLQWMPGSERALRLKRQPTGWRLLLRPSQTWLLQRIVHGRKPAQIVLQSIIGPGNQHVTLRDRYMDYCTMQNASWALTCSNLQEYLSAMYDAWYVLLLFGCLAIAFLRAFQGCFWI